MSARTPGARQWKRIDARALRAWPLPSLAGDADKDERGKVLVVGGSREIAGAVLLAATAALRAGAGKLVVATGASAATALALQVPEARVVGLAETRAGAFGPAGAAALTGACEASAVLVGPGMADAAGTRRFVAALMKAAPGVPLVLDALAMDVLLDCRRFDRPVLLTPHAGEMAHLLGVSKDAVLDDPAGIAARASVQWNAVVALKGATTWIASPEGGRWRHDAVHPGLGTSGSGDVLAGLIAGLAARGASLEQACAWGVALHALAGGQLERDAPLGYLARELSGEVPGLMKKLGALRVKQRARAPKAA